MCLLANRVSTAGVGVWGPPGTEQNAPSSSLGQFLSEAGETRGAHWSLPPRAATGSEGAAVGEPALETHLSHLWVKHLQEGGGAGQGLVGDSWEL